MTPVTRVLLVLVLSVFVATIASLEAQQAAQHDARRTGSDRLCYIAAMPQATIGNHRDTVGLGHSYCFADCGQLRDAHPGYYAGRADRTGTDPDSQTVGTGGDQVLGRLCRGDVSYIYLNVILPFYPDRVSHARHCRGS